MDLPNLFSTPAVTQKSYLALLMTDCTVQATLWQVAAGHITELSHSGIHDYDTQDDCMVATDKALQDLGPQSENVNEVVFGFEPGWVNSAGIVDAKKPLLKKLTQQLSLKAAGFVVITEALFQHLKDQEPLVSALVISLSASNVMVMLIKQGLLVGTETVGRSSEAVADVTEALARLSSQVAQKQTVTVVAGAGHKANSSAGTDKSHDSAAADGAAPAGFPPGYLPSKFLLAAVGVASGEVTAVQQQLLSHSWIDSHQLLHQPTVDVLPEKTSLEVVTHQGGRAVAEAQGLLPSATQATSEKEPEPEPELPDVKLSPVANAEAPIKHAGKTEADEADNQDFGFHPIDLPEQTELEPINSTLGQPPAKAHAPLPHVSMSHLGQSAPELAISTPAVDNELMHSDFKPVAAGSFMHAGNHSIKNADLFSHSSPYPHSVTPAHPSPKIFVMAGLAAGLLVLGGLGFWSLSSLTTAKIMVLPITKMVAKDLVVTLNPGASSNSSSGGTASASSSIAAQVVSLELTGEKTGAATGIKLIGEKAVGTVTMINKTDSVKSFGQGTKLTAGKFSFTLDKEVTVASASVSQKTSEGETRTYGKTDVTVSAAAIGPESNLPKDTQFQVAEFATTTYAAVAKAALAGGTSRESRVVAEKDREKLLTDVKTELSKQAEESWKKERAGGVFVVPTGKVTVAKAEYDHKAGEEADTLNIKVNAKVEGLSYKLSDLTPIAQAALTPQLPTGFTLANTPPQVLTQPLTPSSTASGSASRSTAVQLTVNVSQLALPVLATDDWKKDLAGLTMAQAESYLKQKSELSSATVKLLPSISQSLWGKIPATLDKISIEVSTPR